VHSRNSNPLRLRPLCAGVAISRIRSPQPRLPSAAVAHIASYPPFLWEDVALAI